MGSCCDRFKKTLKSRNYFPEIKVFFGWSNLIDAFAEDCILVNMEGSFSGIVATYTEVPASYGLEVEDIVVGGVRPMNGGTLTSWSGGDMIIKNNKWGVFKVNTVPFTMRANANSYWFWVILRPKS